MSNKSGRSRHSGGKKLNHNNAAVTLLQSLIKKNQQLTVQVNDRWLTVPQALELAEKLGSSGEVQAAILIYTQLLEQAAAWHREQRLDDAEAVYRQVFEAQPAYIDALHLIGVIYSQRGDHVTAERLIRQALRENPRSDTYQNNLGRSLEGQGRFEDAADCYQRTVTLNPEHVLAWNNLGKVQAQCGRWDEAISAFRQAVALRPDFGEAQRNLENALNQAGKAHE